MKEIEKLEGLFEKYGYTKYKWVEPRDIVTGQWVRMKCMFGCKGYGRSGSCPPNAPSVSECRQFFDEYKKAAIIRFEKGTEKPEDRIAWARDVNKGLLALEREVFLSGYQKAFVLPIDGCATCEDCPGVREKCKDPQNLRPTPEALCVDIYSTVRKHDYPIQVLTNYSQVMNRYAILLIE